VTPGSDTVLTRRSGRNDSPMGTPKTTGTGLRLTPEQERLWARFAELLFRPAGARPIQTAGGRARPQDDARPPSAQERSRGPNTRPADIVHDA
jgi:hypothetical protein